MLKCILCNLLFPNKMELDSHKINTHQLVQLTCSYKLKNKKCPFKTFSMSALSNHVALKHKQENYMATIEKGISCESPSKQYVIFDNSQTSLTEQLICVLFFHLQYEKMSV